MKGSSGQAKPLRDLDWSTTPLGPRESWPEDVRAAVDVVCGIGDRMLASVAHELRNTLLPMITAVELIREGEATSELLDMLDRQIAEIRRQIERLAPRDAKADVRKLRVLVVDDNQATTRALELALGMTGHEVAVAHDGPQALAVAETFAPEIALLDLGLPGMDGYELARQLRERAPVALIAVSGNESDEARTREAGFARHLIKPVDLPVLQRAIASAAGTR